MKINHALFALLTLTLGACSGGGGGGGSGAAVGANTAVVAARAPDFSSGAVSLVNRAAPFTARNNLAATISDIVVRSGGDHYFLIERFGTDRISRYAAANPATPVFTYSTQDAGDTESSNPIDLLIVSPTKAYLLRYGAGTLWIVNPSATTEAAFKTGEIDLSQYDPVDGVPEMTGGLIRDGLLYVTMQRLENFAAVKNSFVAVIDTASDMEIPTGNTMTPPLGIELPAINASRIVASAAGGAILVLADGGFDSSFEPMFAGGIVRIDPMNFGATLLLDDGTPGNAPFGQLVDLDIAASDRAYFIGSAGFFGTQTLYRFNPLTAAAPVAVSAAQGVNLSTLSVDAAGQLWLGRAEDTAPGLTVLGFSGGAETVLAPLIDTVLTPLNIDFVSAP